MQPAFPSKSAGSGNLPAAAVFVLHDGVEIIRGELPEGVLDVGGRLVPIQHHRRDGHVYTRSNSWLRVLTNSGIKSLRILIVFM